MKSLTLGLCRELGHKPVRHSPDGVDLILECTECCKAWLVKGGTGEEIRLTGSAYERRLTQQRFNLKLA
jgi:hypothetical protein